MFVNEGKALCLTVLVPHGEHNPKTILGRDVNEVVDEAVDVVDSYFN